MGVKNFEPIIRFNNFGTSNISMTVILRTKEYIGQFGIKSEFMKKLQKRFNAENIKIPVPVIAINNSQELNSK